MDTGRMDTKKAQGLRADAERNRELVVRAAHEAFAAEGVDVSMAEIARRAGVGFATAQRRFPTKETLIEEVVREQLATVTGATHDAAQEPDPWTAFAGPIEACCAHQASEPGLAGPLAQIMATVQHGSTRPVLAQVFVSLAARAKASGDLRPDVELDDVLLILKANAGVIANSPGDEAAASRRFVRLALRSLRATTEPA